MNDTKKNDTAIIVWTERRDGYFHIYATLGYVPNARARAAAPEWGSYRGSRKDGLIFDGLRLVSQGSDADFNGGTANRHLYGWDVEYRDLFSLDLRDAERYAKSLRVLDRRLKKLRDAQGWPKTYAQFVGQVAQAIKAKRFYFRQERQYGQRHDVYSTRTSISDGINYIESMEAEWRDAGQPKEVGA